MLLDTAIAHTQPLHHPVGSKIFRMCHRHQIIHANLPGSKLHNRRGGFGGIPFPLTAAQQSPANFQRRLFLMGQMLQTSRSDDVIAALLAQRPPGKP